MLKIPPAITGHCFPGGHAMTETMRPASLIVIGHNPGGGPVMPPVPLMLTGPAGPSVPQGPVAGKVSGTGWTSPGRDRSGLWLRNAAAGLCVLAAAAAAVSFTAQYRMVDATRHLPVIAALEALIPDAAALVFACLGIALALHGRRALRARALNTGLRRRQRVHERDRRGSRLAEPGHLGPAAHRLRPGQRHLDRRRPGPPPAAGRRHAHPAGRSSAAWPGGCCAWRWPLPSTLAGFRAWVLAECPVAPGRRARHRGRRPRRPRGR